MVTKRRRMGELGIGEIEFIAKEVVGVIADAVKVCIEIADTYNIDRNNLVKESFIAAFTQLVQEDFNNYNEITRKFM